MRVVPVPCLQDNYAYLVICEATNTAAVIDPSAAEPVLQALEREGMAQGVIELVAIWNTHHHWDHTGGNKELLDTFPEMAVVGHESDRGRIPGQTTFVSDGDQVTLGDEVVADILYNPGHTLGAISYYLEAHKAVFTGDTLFLAGCGRMFEGTAAMMHESLSRLAALPGDTQVYCGHEYTAANLRFASTVEPDNQAVQLRIGVVATMYDRGQASVPGIMAEELATNPFLRTQVPSVATAARQQRAQTPAGTPDAANAAGMPDTDDSPAAIFGALRAWKDGFRG